MSDFRLGQHLVQCDRCGFSFYSSQVAKEWTGLLVCRGPGTRHCWEPRHPVDFIRSAKDLHGVRETRERDTDELAVTNTILYWDYNYTDDDFGEDPYVSP